MLTIQLLDLQFHAFHGVFEGEFELGSDYEVSLTVTYSDRVQRPDTLENVLNYLELYEIVKKRMLIASPLLEEVAESVVGKVKHQYPFLKEITFSIYKLQAPIEHFHGKVGITLQKKFED